MSTIRYEHYALSVCTDCLSVMANGEAYDSDGNDLGPSIVAAWTDEGWGNDVLVPGDIEEGHFSSSPCEACGSTLGGDRHPAHALGLPPGW